MRTQWAALVSRLVQLLGYWAIPALVWFNAASSSPAGSALHQWHARLMQQVGALGASLFFCSLALVLLLDARRRRRRPSSEGPEPGTLMRLALVVSENVAVGIGLWGALLIVRGYGAGSDHFWESTLPFYVSAVLLVNVPSGALPKPDASWRWQLGRLFLGGLFSLPNVWVNERRDVKLEVRAFNRGLLIPAALGLAVCGVLGIGFWPGIAVTAFVSVTSLVYAFVCYRVRLRGADAPSSQGVGSRPAVPQVAPSTHLQLR